MLGPVNHPNDISLPRANQSQAKFKCAVGRYLLQSWVNLTIVKKLQKYLTPSEEGPAWRFKTATTVDGKIIQGLLTSSVGGEKLMQSFIQDTEMRKANGEKGGCR